MTVTMRKRRRPRPALKLDPERIRRGPLAPGIYGVTAAMSADGLWLFRGDLVRWAGEYLPTGNQVIGGTLPAVRRKAGDPASLEAFRVDAADVIAELGPHVDTLDGTDAATTYRLARRRLAVLEGRLVAAPEFDGVCACGGYLIGDVHGDGCLECVGVSPGLRIRCPGLEHHQACDTVDPVLCDHWCRRRAVPAPCWRGRDFCCGCCDPR